jgi:hypothetical protein
MEDAFVHRAAECGIGRRQDCEVIVGVVQGGNDFCDGVAAKDGVDLLEEFGGGAESFCETPNARLCLGDGKVAAFCSDCPNPGSS